MFFFIVCMKNIETLFLIDAWGEKWQDYNKLKQSLTYQQWKSFNKVCSKGLRKIKRTLKNKRLDESFEDLQKSYTKKAQTAFIESQKSYLLQKYAFTECSEITDLNDKETCHKTYTSPQQKFLQRTENLMQDFQTAEKRYQRKLARKQIKLYFEENKKSKTKCSEWWSRQN